MTGFSTRPLRIASYLGAISGVVGLCTHWLCYRWHPDGPRGSRLGERHGRHRSPRKFAALYTWYLGRILRPLIPRGKEPSAICGSGSSPQPRSKREQVCRHPAIPPEMFLRGSMNRAAFDRFADEYHALHAQNIGVTGETPDYFAEYKIRDVFNQSRKANERINENLKILDFGCGVVASFRFGVVPFRPVISFALTCRREAWTSRMAGSKMRPLMCCSKAEVFPSIRGLRHRLFRLCVSPHPVRRTPPLLQEIRRVLGRFSDCTL